ncbi:MAG: GNAT family N-acetyltransferase [Acidobacteriota bacterium]
MAEGGPPRIPEAPPGFRLRRYEPSDWNAYLDLDLISRLEDRGLDPETKEQFRHLRIRRLHRAYQFTEQAPPVHPPHQIFVVQHESGEYAAHLWIADKSDPLTDECFLYVNSVAVKQKFRHNGLGVYFVRFVEALARIRGVKDLQVDVVAENLPAFRLFNTQGFQIKVQRLRKMLDAG